MNKILLIIICLLLFPILSFGQTIGGEKNPLGGQQYKYTYACPPIESESGVSCTIKIKNGKSNVSSLFLGKYGSGSSFKVTWDNINGSGSISIMNTEKGTASHDVHITKQCTTTTISENITNNRNITDCNVVLTNASISNNAAVNISADKSITINPTTTIKNGTNVRFYITSASAYAVNKMENEETQIACAPYKSASDNEQALFQNVPNPFTGQTVIACNVPEPGNNSFLNIYNMMGSLIHTIPLNSPGHHEIIIEGSGLKPGFYSYSLIVDNQLLDTKRMIVGE